MSDQRETILGHVTRTGHTIKSSPGLPAACTDCAWRSPIYDLIRPMPDAVRDPHADTIDPGPVPAADTRPIDITTAFRTRIRQAIRAADMNSDARSEASWLDEMATAVLGIARAGADDTTGPEGAEVNPGQWVALFVDSDGPRRRQLAGRVISNSTAAAACFEGDHAGQLAAMRRELLGATALHDAAAEALADLTQQIVIAKAALRDIAHGDTAAAPSTARAALHQLP